MAIASSAAPDQMNAVDSGDPSLIELINILARRLRLLGSWTVGGGLAVLLVAFLAPTRFTSSASFVPQVPGTALSSLAGVAAQFGLSLPTQDPTQSPDFYAAFVNSHQLMEDVVDAPLQVPEGDSVRYEDLVTLWDLRGHGPADRREATIVELNKWLNAQTDRVTGLVTVTMTDPHPQVAFQVVQRVLALVNQFNLVQRQSQARDERAFIAGRRDSAEADLRTAEERLQSFMVRNRDFRNSPALQFEYDRLNRAVSMRQDLFTTLAQSYEQARIEEVRNTPVITVVERAEIPVRPDRKHLGLKLLLGLFLGAGAGASIVLGGEWLRRVESRDPAAVADLRSHFVALRRLVGRRHRNI